MFTHAFLLFSLINEQNVFIDLKQFQWKAIVGDKVTNTGKASGGRRWCPDIERGCKTPSGIFRVLTKRGRYYRSPLYPLGCGNPREGKKPCAKMAWAIKFRYDGPSIHASENDDWNNPKHISHGCIHVTMEDARWLNQWVSIGTKIVILPY